MVKGNKYTDTQFNTWLLFESYVAGNDSSLVTVVFNEDLSEESIRAINNSFQAFNYGPGAATFIDIQGKYRAVTANNTQLALTSHINDFKEPETQNAPGQILTPEALYALIEGLDPACIISADSACTELLQKAYRTRIAIQGTSHLLGRPTVTFSNLNSLMTSDKSKVEAWLILKTLPPFKAD